MSLESNPFGIIVKLEGEPGALKVEIGYRHRLKLLIEGHRIKITKLERREIFHEK